MYHIKEDKRAHKSALLIYEALQKCLKEKDFNKITITDIQRTSSVGRATFYRHFDQLSDVLYWQCDRRFYEVLNNYSGDLLFDSKQFLVYYFNYWMGNCDLIELLLNIKHQDIIFDCHLRNAKIITDKYQSNLKILNEHYKYNMGIRISITIGMLITWIEGGKKETANELVEIIYKQIDFIRNSEIIV